MTVPILPPGAPGDWDRRALLLASVARQLLDEIHVEELATDYGMPPGPERNLKRDRTLDRIRNGVTA